MDNLVEDQQVNDFEQRTFSFEELEGILFEAFREMFVACFERKFGSPTPEVLKRLDASHVIELKQWIPNISSAAKADDVFISDLERALVQVAASAIKRKSHIDVGDVASLAQLRDALDKHT